MTSGCSMLARILSFPPQRAHWSISTPNTRLSRRAQPIATGRGVGGVARSAGGGCAAPLPRCADVTVARSWQYGANTP